MSRLDQLPPDQRAALSLLLRQRKSYAEVAVLLGIAEDAVRNRAQAALAVLAPAQARALSAEQRLQIADYMLTQQTSIAERLRTRTLLGSTHDARVWAQALAAELASIAGAELPEIPAGSDAPAPPAPTPGAFAQPPEQPGAPPLAGAPSASLAAAVTAAPSETQPPSSRVGGALLLAAIAVVAIVVVAIVLSSGGGSHHHSGSTSTTASTPAKSSATTTSSTKGAEKVLATIVLASPSAKSKAVGEAEVIADGEHRGLAVATTNLPPTKGFYYALWLYNSPTSAVALARAPEVGASHGFDAVALLPSYARKYKEVLLTRETETAPKTPGPVALRGKLTLTE